MTQLAIVMDPIENINYKKDSSLAMLWAAKKMGWRLFYIKPSNLFIDNGEAKCICQPLDVFENPEHYYQLEHERTTNLASMNVILMRKDPPFDNEFIYNTYILELAETAGSLIINKPQSLRDCNEKVFATHFPQCCPPVRVTANPELLKAFHQTHGDVIFKPLDGMGGSQIFRLKPNDPNVSVIIETLTDFGKNSIMAQKFIPEISEGDKRILLINGEPIPYGLARIPAKGETRGNLAAGGRGVPVELNQRDRWICEQIAPTLKKKGLLFVGIDVIGDYLTEINVTSPTCIREIDNAYNLDIAGKLMNVIEGMLN